MNCGEQRCTRRCTRASFRAVYAPLLQVVCLIMDATSFSCRLGMPSEISLDVNAYARLLSTCTDRTSSALCRRRRLCFCDRLFKGASLCALHAACSMALCRPFASSDHLSLRHWVKQNGFIIFFLLIFHRLAVTRRIGVVQAKGYLPLLSLTRTCFVQALLPGQVVT